MKNGVDLRHNNEPGGCSESKNEPTRSWMNKIRAGFAFVTVEPFLVCLILAPAVSSVAVHRLYSEKACRVDLNYTKEDCDKWDDNVAIQTNSMVNDVLTWGGIFQSGVLTIVLIFVGAWSDLTGNRKALMVVPILGGLVSAFGLMLATYFFEELPLFFTRLIDLLPTALSGGYYVPIMGSYCYLADVTSLETRTFRMGIASTVIGLCRLVAIAIAEILNEHLDYYGSFGASTALYFLGLLYTYSMIHEVKPIEIETPWYKKIMRFCNPENAWSTISIAYKSGPDREKILLVVAAYFVICGPIHGKGGIMYEYFTQHFLMEYAEYIVFIKYVQLIGTCGILLAVTLFSKYLKVHDAILGILAAASNVMSSCMYALAPNTLWLYSAPVLDLIGGSSVTVVKSLGTKVVAPQHIAKVFSLLSLTEAIIPLIYQPMYIRMYNNTKNIMMGAVYLLVAAMTAPAILIFIVIYKQFKKEERNKLTAPQNNELYADQNYITPL